MYISGFTIMKQVVKEHVMTTYILTFKNIVHEKVCLTEIGAQQKT